MKKVIFLILLPIITYSQGWFVSHTFSPAQSLQTIRFWDANTGYTTAPIYNGSTFNIHKTTNGGANWSDQSSGFTSMRFMAIWIIHPDTVYISGNSGKILKTVNGGVNWIPLNTNDTVTQYWGLQFVNSFTGFAAGSAGKIIKTTDRGTTWIPVVSGISNALSNMHFRNEITGYISGSAIMLKTTNSGINWTGLSAPYIGFETIRDIYFTDDNTGFGASDAGRLFKTTNAGANWELIPCGTSESLFGIFFTDPNTAIACGNNGAIVRTTNAGLNWQLQVSPLTEILTDVWFTSANTGYISTWTGKVLKTTNGGVTFLSQISNEIPQKFSLEQNYPNPFNPVTKINFSIPTSGAVRLAITDVSGREIAVLVDQSLQPGTFEVNWSADKYSSGVYFYSLLAEGFVQSKKMVLVK